MRIDGLHWVLLSRLQKLSASDTFDFVDAIVDVYYGYNNKHG